MSEFEIFVGRNATLRLSPGTARLLYRGLLTLQSEDGRTALPTQVREYIEQRRIMLGCGQEPVDLRGNSAAGIDDSQQRLLADRIVRIAARLARPERARDAIVLSPVVRARFIATLIELYRLICANLPLNLTLPPPLGISMSEEDWRLVEIERLRIRSENSLAAPTEGPKPEPDPDPAGQRIRLIEELASLQADSAVIRRPVHRTISLYSEN